MSRRSILVVSVAMSLGACGFDPPQRPFPGADADADGEDNPYEADADSSPDHADDADAVPVVTPTDERAGLYSGDDVGEAPICRNDIDEDDDGLFDCADVGCLGDPLCCVDDPDPVVEGDFHACGERGGLEACGWTRFLTPSDGDAVRLSTEGLVLLGGDGDGEVGLYSRPMVGLAGGPVLTFVASLEDVSCESGPCSQFFAVALSHQQAFSSGTGVQPTLGVALDGELRVVHFLNGGRVEHSQPLVDEGALTRPLLYGFQLGSDGTVSFWGQAEPEEVDRDSRPTGAPSFTSTVASSSSAREVRVVAFGRLQGSDRARLERIDISQRICDVPDGWSFVAPSAVLAPPEGSNAAGSPTVFEVAGELVMVYERDHGLAAATSSDSGRTWDHLGNVLDAPPRTQYGLVDVRMPSVIEWAAPGDATTRFHLWYIGEAEAGQSTPAGVTPTAVLHAVSDDGLAWSEQEEDISIEATSGIAWMSEVASPTVAIDPRDELLRMWFVGSSPYGVESAILAASSSDGKQWTVDETPIAFGLVEAEPAVLPFERDGRGEPMVIEHNGVFHLWYEGTNGARSSIGYAVSADGVRWQRFGNVLGATTVWEAQRVSAPAVLVVPAATETTERILLFYQAGVVDRERIGLATRAIPVWDYLPQP